MNPHAGPDPPPGWPALRRIAGPLSVIPTRVFVTATPLSSFPPALSSFPRKRESRRAAAPEMRRDPVIGAQAGMTQ